MAAIYDGIWDQLQLPSFMASTSYPDLQCSMEALWNGDIRFFPLYYWLILVFSVSGMTHSLVQLYQHAFKKKSNTHINSKVLKVLACSQLFIVAQSWLILVYAALVVSPAKMYVWLVIHCLLLILQHWGIALNNALMGDVWFWPKSAKTVISLLINLGKIGIVYQTMCAFDVALTEERPEELMLLSKILKAI
ncbi:uncharacterized protein LOC111071277 [Drosophila obscura]|uniref:uncharacterized protein LOC111071277 n=1 Tax=Drosophila obscura TaxID=7282 RepID=UPI001BB10C9F|nr:uncharacterized protein LOC111071277 [Drosophila obscura]